MKCEWKECTIGDLGQIITGKTPSTKNSDYWNGDIHFITPKDLQSTKHIFKTERYITKAGFYSIKGARLPIGSVCITCIGNIGYVGITTEKCVSNQQINSIIPNEQNDANFVYYLMKSLWSYFKNYEGQSTALSILNKTQFSKIKVAVPHLDVQIKISKILSLLDDKIELNNAINNNLEQQAQAIFKSWFVDFEPFNKVMPSDWFIGTVDNLAKEVICGKTPSTKRAEFYGSDIPFITIPDMHGKIYTLTTERYLSKLGANCQAKKTLPKNSVCVSCIGTAGLVTLVAEESQTNQQINSIVPKENFSSYYIYLLMHTLSDTINKFGQSGSTIVNLNKAQFGKIKVVIPSISVMTQFDEIVTPIFEKILENQKENLNLASLRNTLLPKLMSGELDVSNIDL